MTQLKPFCPISHRKMKEPRDENQTPLIFARKPHKALRRCVVWLLVPSLGISAPSARAQSEQKETAMTEQNKAVVRRLFDEVWNGGKLEAIPELYGPDFVAHYRPPTDFGESAKLCGARALFRYFITPSVIKSIKILGTIDGHLK
jgi:hypothetical protein